jgi:hypothetical protein
VLATSAAGAQFAPAPAPNNPPPYGYSGAPQYAPQPYAYTSPASTRSDTEIGVLYVTSAVYGAGVGVWLDSELDVKDPGLFLISPAVLGIAGPTAVYFLDTQMRRGLPAAIAAGAVIGAGEGIGISSLQFVSAKSENAWGFRGLARATTLGATLGAAGGAVVGSFDSPSPRSSALITSSVVWGSAIGAMFGYGASARSIGYGRANDSAGLGGLIGFNVALVGAGALSAVYIPTTLTLEAMWAGAGIGFAVSTPVYLFYVDKDGPPAKRGLIFSATATTLGIAAGALFTANSTEPVGEGSARPAFATLKGVAPLIAPGVLGISMAGELF